MKVNDLQHFLRSLVPPLTSSGGARVAEDLEKAALGLDPFKDKTITEFCNFLSKVGEHFVQTGALPAAGRRRAEPRPGSDEKVKDATQRVLSLYEKANDADFSEDAMMQEMTALGEMTLNELKLVGREIGLTKSMRRKEDALQEIEQKIRERRANPERKPAAAQDGHGEHRHPSHREERAGEHHAAKERAGDHHRQHEAPAAPAH